MQDGTMQDDRGPETGAPQAGAAGTAPTRFEQLAKVVLVLALAVVALATFFVLPTAAEEGLERFLVVLIAVALAASLPALALFGLFTRAAWRRPVAGTALWFLVLSGILEFVVQAGAGGVSIPFLAIAAGIVLTDRAPRRITGHVAVRVTAVVLGVAAIGWYLIGLVLAGAV